MSYPMFTLTRRRKIGILISVIGVLCLGALLSTYVADTPHKASSRHGRNALKTRDGDKSESFGILGSKTLRRSGHKKNTHSDSSFLKGHKESGPLSLKGHKSGPHKRQPKEHKDRNQRRPVPTLSVKMAAKKDEKFNVARVLHLFSTCRKSDDEILIDCYVDGYEELCKLFKAFGSAFSFVTSDVLEKIEILRDYRKSPEADEYASVQSLLSYEVEKGITNNKKKASGSRTLLRLHRALEFVEELLVKIRDTDNTDKFSTVACQAYDDTLAKHHPWLIKKAVHLAMYILPTRAELIKKMSLEDSENGMSDLSKLIDKLKIIYEITQDLYTEKNLLDLP